MMQNGAIDTVEHVMFGYWLRNKINAIEQQHLQRAVIENQKRPLEELKQRLPEGIQIFFFEPSVIFAQKDYSYLIRAFGHDSVKFKVVPELDGKYFRFEDTKDQQALFFAQVDKEKKHVVMLGDGSTIKYKWQIVPTDNATFFYILNKSNKFAISSEEYEKCARNEGILGRCTGKDLYNVAKVVDPDDDKQKWMITTHIIRNGILKDRLHTKL
jgi:hypothetical protein